MGVMPRAEHTSGMLGRAGDPVGFSLVTICRLPTRAKAITHGSADVRSFDGRSRWKAAVAAVSSSVQSM